MKRIDSNTFLVDSPFVADFLNNRPPEAHKGNFGHALIVAGSYGKMGAAVLAARACLRAGAGLLTVHVPRCGVEIMQTAVPEAMVTESGDRHWSGNFSADELGRYDVVAVGPGIGMDSTDPLRSLLAVVGDRPVVLDADAINMLSVMEDGLMLIGKGCRQGVSVLTPHAKEFERLFGSFGDTEERLRRQRRLSRELGAIIVNKGHGTQTTGRNGELYINTTGNPGMATAGSGDVLTGILAGIIAQNKQNQLDMEDCVALGVWLHGKSADSATQKQSQCSLIAGDIVENLKYVTI